MNTYTRFILAASVLAGFTSCETYQKMREPIYLDPAGNPIPAATQTTVAPAVEGQVPADAQATAQAQTEATLPTLQPEANTPQPVPNPPANKPVIRNNAGPFSAPNVTDLPSKEDLRESETSTNRGGSTPGITVPKQ